MQYNDIAYLCGYFSAKTGIPSEIMASKSDFWSLVQYQDDEMIWARDFYFPEFAEMMMTEVKTYSHICNSRISVALWNGRSQDLHLEELRVYLFPFGIVMYSVKVRQQSEELQDMLDALFAMRGICSLNEAALKDYISLALDPLLELSRAVGNAGGFRSLMECGNKLKVYHTLICDQKSQDEQEFDRLLYSCGTFSVYDENDSKGFSEKYYLSIMSRSIVSVFNNWKALSLLDTFTILAHDIDDNMLNIWNNEYFGKLYLYALYRKFFLFRINGDFRSEVKKVSAVRNDLTIFEKDYTFPKVSYNFLPEMIVNSMESGLDVKEETVKIAEIIKRENARKETERGDRMNLFLCVITCLTIFSAIWDFACLMDGVFVFSANIGTAAGVRACTMVLISILCIVAMVLRKK